MIVINVDLHSAATGEVTSLNRVVICNIGTPGRFRNYHVRSFRKGYDPVAEGSLNQSVNRSADVKRHNAAGDSVLTLLRKALSQMGY